MHKHDPENSNLKKKKTTLWNIIMPRKLPKNNITDILNKDTWYGMIISVV